MSQQSFRALGVSAEVERSLAARDITSPFRIQSLVLADALTGNDVLAKAPTGSGKTLAFALPIVERTKAGDSPAALVLVPTRELALQVAAEIALVAAPKRLRVATVYGGAPLGTQAKRAKTANIVVATPGRLQDLLDRRMISLDRVQILILDEADRMLDMGFKPQVEKILRRMPRERQTMLFSATLDGEVCSSPASTRRTRPASRPSCRREPSRARSTTSSSPSRPTRRSRRWCEELERDRDLALVFVRTKRGAERLVQKLKRHDVHAGCAAR